MKFIVIKLILLITCLGLYVNPNLIKKRERTTQDLDLKLPAIVQAEMPDVKAKADKQVKAARKLFENPNKKTIEILEVVATLLKNSWQTERIKQISKNDEGFNRSINGGVYDPKYKNPKEEKKHVHNKPEIPHFNLKKSNPTNEASSKKSESKETEKLNEKLRMNFIQINRISKVANPNNFTRPLDRVGVLAILGDIGTAILDCPTKRDPNNETLPLIPRKINDVLKEEEKSLCDVTSSVAKITNTNLPDLLEEAEEAKKKRGGSAIAKNKKEIRYKNKTLISPAERADKLNDTTHEVIKTPRSGLLTQTTDGSGFTASWPWQMIPNKYLTDCAEPWSGHYSGSIVELLFTLDLFTKANTSVGDDPMKSFKQNTMLDNENRRCKAALAGAFLISIGYHSAIEVKPTIWAYLGRGNIGENPKIFSLANPNCDTSATDDLVALMKGCTEKKINNKN